MGKEYEGMGLSETELAALEEEKKPVSAAKGAEEKPKKEDLPEEDPPAEEPEEKDPPAEDPPADEPKEQEPKEEEADPYDALPLQDFQPYEAKHVADFDAKITEFDKQRAALVTQFKDGELTLEDFIIKDREIQSAEQQVRDTEREAATMDKLNEQNASRAWFANVKTFISEVKRVEGINYDNATLNAALDSAVKTLAQDPANAEKPQLWFLREAHRVVMGDLGIARGAAPAAEEPAKTEKKGRVPDLSGVPQTLAKVPAAAPNDPTGGDEFGHLEKLDGMELEEALAKMTPAQEARYLRG